MPEISIHSPEAFRAPFIHFPPNIGDWQAGCKATSYSNIEGLPGTRWRRKIFVLSYWGAKRSGRLINMTMGDFPISLDVASPVRQGATWLSRRSMLLALPALVSCGPDGARPQVTLNIASDGDELAFRPARLSCPRGCNVTLFFRHAGSIMRDPHDWVLLKPGTEKAFLKAADASPGDDGIVAANRNDIIARTPLCPMGETVRVDFAAPAPGTYPFVCSVPGHGDSMRGTLSVTT
jgi:azurin